MIMTLVSEKENIIHKIEVCSQSFKCLSTYAHIWRKREKEREIGKERER